MAATKKLPIQKAKTAGINNKTKHRSSTIKWINANMPETTWILSRVGEEILKLNNQFYNYDLYGFDSLQLTEYKTGGYYDWHMDTLIGLRDNQSPPRKLSATILLNDDYKGGEFEFFNGFQNAPDVPELKKGSIVVFPSFMYHRVAPVTEGTRYSLVAWVLGPLFK